MLLPIRSSFYLILVLALSPGGLVLLPAFGQGITEHVGILPSPFSTQTTLKVEQDEELIRYHTSASFIENVTVEVPSFIVRISPSLDGAVSRLQFPLYNGPLNGGGSAPGVVGDGSVRIELFEFQGPDSLPEIEDAGLAMVEIDLATLNASAQVPIPESAWNVIDLPLEAFSVKAGNEYLVRILLVDLDQNATLTFLTDAGSTDETDTDYYPVRTYVFLQPGVSDNCEGHCIYPDHDNLVIDFTVVGQTGTRREQFEEEQPRWAVLAQNHPNPFYQKTTIQFGVTHAAPVSLVIYDALGKEVTRLLDRSLAAGEHAVTWNASRHPSGIYFCRLEVGGEVHTKVMTFRR